MSTYRVIVDRALAVVRAWTDEGVNPGYHRRKQAQLRREWPVLAEAIEALAKALGRRS